MFFVVYIRRFIYKFLNVCPFDYTAVAGSGKVGPVNQVNHTSWAAVVTPTHRPKSVPNRCVIELFVVLFVLSLCPFGISVSVGAFVIGVSSLPFSLIMICECVRSCKFYPKLRLAVTNGNSARSTSTHIRPSICYGGSDIFSSEISGKLPKIETSNFIFSRTADRGEILLDKFEDQAQ